MHLELETLFHDLLALSDEDRRTHLERLRATRPELHRELASLLEAFGLSSGFLEPAAPESPTEQPTHLGKYEIRELLGRGASGIVYLGHDPSLHREVAIKVLIGTIRRERTDDLQKEARSLASVVHPNVAQVYSVETSASGDFGDTANRGVETPLLFLTMEYVPGTTLSERIRSGPLPLEVCLDYGRQIAGALEAAHIRSVVHRDLKPQNIRITPDGWVKVLDFGLAHRLTSATGGERMGSAGTPGYMSPEQCRGEEIDHRSDLWSLGAVLYECLVGTPAVPGETLRDLFEANRKGIVDLRAISSAVPSRTQSLIRNALDADRVSRLNSATTARHVLEEELLRIRAMSLVETRPRPLGPIQHDPDHTKETGREPYDDLEGRTDQASDPALDPPSGPETETDATLGPRSVDIAATQRGNLPTPLSSFVGREAWIADTTGRLSSHRLVTVTGPGGVGKTRTCLEIASRLAARFPAGVWFVDLAGVSNELDVPGVAMHALRLRESGPGGSLLAPGAAIASLFSTEAGLLILDNCEHLVSGVARFLEELLALGSALTVLTTSRNPIGIVGEEIAILPPLSAPDKPEAPESVELFLQRARSRAPGFTVGDRGLATIREICARLDGLPLAIELAAGQARSLPLEETLRRVREGRSLGRTGNVPSRHRSLHDLVAWSYRLLQPKERAVLRRMTVFRGGCTLGSIEAVCGGWGEVESWEVCDLVVRLVESSLVEMVSPNADSGPDAEPRYRLLETIRSFAAEQFLPNPSNEPGEQERTERAYIDAFVGLAGLRDNEDGPSRASWVARIDPDYANLLHALDLALESTRWGIVYALGDLLTYYWFHMGQWVVGERWLGRILALRGGEGRLSSDTSLNGGALSAGLSPSPVERAAEVRFLAQAGFLYSELGRVGSSKPLLDESLRLGKLLGEPSPLAFAFQVSAIAAWKRSELDVAEANLEQSLHYATIAGERGAIAAALGNLGVIESSRGRNDRALGYYRRHLEESRSMGDPGAIAACLGNIGWCSWGMGDLDEAKRAFEETLELVTEMRNTPNIAMVRQNLGEVCRRLGQLQEGWKLIVTAGQIRKEIGDNAGLTATIFSLARIAEEQSLLALAVSLAFAIIDRFGDRTFVIAPGTSLSVEAWRVALAEKIGSDAVARAREAVAGMSLADVFDLGVERTRQSASVT